METVYDLRKSPDLSAMQRASLQPGPVGLKITHGLVGSDEWWQTIANGGLLSHTMSGHIQQFWPGHHGDFSEFELVTPGGVSSRWPCSVDLPLATRGFVVGRSVEVDYVIQEFKEASFGDGTTKLVVAIRLGPNNSFKPKPLRGSA